MSKENLEKETERAKSSVAIVRAALSEFPCYILIASQEKHGGVCFVLKDLEKNEGKVLKELIKTSLKTDYEFFKLFSSVIKEIVDEIKNESKT